MKALLTREQVEALQNVNLQLGFIGHGAPADFGHHGPGVTGVEDGDYGLVHDLVTTMQLGDVLVRESVGGNQFPDDPNRLMFDTKRLLANSPCVTHSPLKTPRIEEWSMAMRYVEHGDEPKGITELPEFRQALTESAQLMRRFRLDSPLAAYSDVLALAGGLRRVVADSPPEIYNDDRLNGRQRRNADMVRGLGVAAVSILQSYSVDAPKPTFTFIAGKRHQGVEKLLKQVNVPFASQSSVGLRRTLGLWARAFSANPAVHAYNGWLDNIHRMKQ